MLVNLAAVPILPEHIWSKMCHALARSQAAARSFGQQAARFIGEAAPFQCHAVDKKSNFLVMEANQELLARRAAHDNRLRRTYTNADTSGPEHEGRRDRRLPAAFCKRRCRRSHTPRHHRPARSAPTSTDELGFNCYTRRARSLRQSRCCATGSSVRRLQWAIDKNKLCQIAYGGMAKPADTVIHRRLLSATPDWHWTPPADQAYTFNLGQGGAQDADRSRLTAQERPCASTRPAKPITLRLV